MDWKEILGVAAVEKVPKYARFVLDKYLESKISRVGLWQDLPKCPAAASHAPVNASVSLKCVVVERGSGRRSNMLAVYWLITILRKIFCRSLVGKKWNAYP